MVLSLPPKEKAPHGLPAKAGTLRVLHWSGSPDEPSMARLSRGRLLPAILTDQSSRTVGARLRRRVDVYGAKEGRKPFILIQAARSVSTFALQSSLSSDIQKEATKLTNRKTHWEQVYADKSPMEVSWYQEEPALSLRLIQDGGIKKG
jgi:hypothetical protein